MVRRRPIQGRAGAPRPSAACAAAPSTTSRAPAGASRPGAGSVGVVAAPDPGRQLGRREASGADRGPAATARKRSGGRARIHARILACRACDRRRAARPRTTRNHTRLHRARPPRTATKPSICSALTSSGPQGRSAGPDAPFGVILAVRQPNRRRAETTRSDPREHRPDPHTTRTPQLHARTTTGLVNDREIARCLRHIREPLDLTTAPVLHCAPARPAPGARPRRSRSLAEHAAAERLIARGCSRTTTASYDQRRGLKRRSGHPLIAAISADHIQPTPPGITRAFTAGGSHRSSQPLSSTRRKPVSSPSAHPQRRQRVERRSNDSGAVAANSRLLGRSAHSSTSGRPLVERQLRGLLDLSEAVAQTLDHWIESQPAIWVTSCKAISRPLSPVRD